MPEKYSLEIAKAIDSALGEKEFNKRKEMQADISLAYLEGHINRDESDALYESEGKIEWGVAEFKTPEEFLEALDSIGLPEEQVMLYYRHELSHYQTDIKNGHESSFLLLFSRIEDGSLSVTPAVKTMYTETPKHKENLRESITAPQDMSEFDKRSVGMT
ncbi:TPA: hypothetical protein DD449_00740 [Candidatus Berkelbacteria bacterium]|uniref:Uncharacterized protein n=1 Tax=Berkelbacteria bacterium GW2011_GWE1_39_12 TaxID=1618337 RepID=A0A0G4B594_9BACT|nr:MAG: hypothetical protein UT28_C0001G0938 [Berkelbacteria bacterium GW2011_GWE1_39_12]HBO60198.1 hypothetical protein [Candidatus Berkelbacteria bacterium]